jgi:hypothetical protein
MPPANPSCGAGVIWGQHSQSENCDFYFAQKIYGLQPLILVSQACVTRNHEKISDYLVIYVPLMYEKQPKFECVGFLLDRARDKAYLTKLTLAYLLLDLFVPGVDYLVIGLRAF